MDKRHIALMKCHFTPVKVPLYEHKVPLCDSQSADLQTKVTTCDSQNAATVLSVTHSSYKKGRFGNYRLPVCKGGNGDKSMTARHKDTKRGTPSDVMKLRIYKI